MKTESRPIEAALWVRRDVPGESRSIEAVRSGSDRRRRIEKTVVACAAVLLALGAIASNGSALAQTAQDSLPRRLTQLPGQDRNASFSPDGRRIVFESDRDGDFDIYALTLADGKIEQLTDHSAADRNPSWSPDGRRIAFESDRNGSWDLYSIQLEDGSQARRLTDHPANERAPAWSPQGASIAFHSDRRGNLDVCILDLETNETVRLTDDPALDAFPGWSPDGLRLTFFSKRGGAPQDDVFIMNRDGSSAARMTRHSGNDFASVFSRSGGALVFASNRSGHSQIFALDIEDSSLRLLQHLPSHCTEPAYSPVDERLVVSCRPKGRTQRRPYDLFLFEAPQWQDMARP